ncbi:MAG: glycerophosphodiester phosphodiesterase family protein [Gammaproteobacteria bacterium]|jgi:glycerophosphoryl diester phosphodiesterase
MVAESAPQLVAHRGYSARYPENTLLSLEQALAAGACFMECDVHLTRDKVPVVLHDHQLQRTTGRSGDILQLDHQQLFSFDAAYAKRFGDQFHDVPIPDLVQLVDLMGQWPQRRVFVELKRASIRHFGGEVVLSAVLEVLQPVMDQVILISFDADIIALAQQRGVQQTGWVTEHWASSVMETARRLQPDYIFVDSECLPGDMASLPDTSWRWVIYEIDDAETARRWTEKGADLIETNDIGGLLAAPYFRGGRCDD